MDNPFHPRWHDDHWCPANSPVEWVNNNHPHSQRSIARFGNEIGAAWEWDTGSLFVSEAFFVLHEGADIIITAIGATETARIDDNGDSYIPQSRDTVSSVSSLIDGTYTWTTFFADGTVVTDTDIGNRRIRRMRLDNNGLQQWELWSEDNWELSDTALTYLGDRLATYNDGWEWHIPHHRIRATRAQCKKLFGRTP